ncbi:symporter small accessory protein [Desulfogranum mediterraneum]|uniref:symporter small accessory protein n=1 Tax=Desulfogranum mediterraneum TaxID=160661 RepID=UPI000413D1F5|nr:symporter small accessory protein [Desulfogranum mediterraneum]
MLGLEGVAVPLGMVLTVLSTVLCIIYGLLNWNRGYITEEELEQEQLWKEEESKVKENL